MSSTRTPSTWTPRVVGEHERRTDLPARARRTIAHTTATARGIVLGAALRVASAVAEEADWTIERVEGGVEAIALVVGDSPDALRRVLARLTVAPTPEPGA